MNELRQFLLFNIILFLHIHSVCSSCKIPTAWFGSWYQHGMNSLLEITIDSIQTKGLCLDVLPSHQYYLFIDRSTRCTRCLTFIQRHINFLQYRESECIDTDDLLNITSCSNMIAPDAVLYTLHRNNSKAQSCPIQPPFLLTNLIKDNSICHQSISSSYINECAHDEQFHLHLSPCLSTQPILDLQFICVGTWIENLNTYFATRILSHHHLNNRYACFRFLTQQNSSSSLLLNMATDDSCHDLYSRRMSTIMTLSSENHQIINQSCTFPPEFQSYDWYSLNQTIRMMITNTNIELLGINKRFHCQKLVHSEKSIRIYQIQTYTNCHKKNECLQIIHRTTNILELSTIPLSKDNRCHKHHHSNFYAIFYTKSSRITHPCPNSLGYLIYQSSMDYYLKEKSFHMSIGCDNKEKLIISEKDKNTQQPSIIQIDTCLASWRSDDLLTIYLIAQSRYSNASYCLSFQMTNPIIIRNNTHGCSFDKSITIYSARLLHPCSQSSQLSSRCLLLIFYLINHFYHSKQ